jgi:hypothetical protein
MSQGRKAPTREKQKKAQQVTKSHIDETGFMSLAEKVKELVFQTKEDSVRGEEIIKSLNNQISKINVTNFSDYKAAIDMAYKYRGNKTKKCYLRIQDRIYTLIHKMERYGRDDDFISMIHSSYPDDEKLQLATLTF